MYTGSCKYIGIHVRMQGTYGTLVASSLHRSGAAALCRLVGLALQSDQAVLVERRGEKRCLKKRSNSKASIRRHLNTKIFSDEFLPYRQTARSVDRTST